MGMTLHSPGKVPYRLCLTSVGSLMHLASLHTGFEDDLTDVRYAWHAT